MGGWLTYIAGLLAFTDTASNFQHRRIDPTLSRPGPKLKISPEAVQRFQRSLATFGPSTREIRPEELRKLLTAAKPPPGVVPDDADCPALAFDSAWQGDLAWMATPFGALTENLYWLGWPYLAELQQRAEYRMLSETPAKEMTRKWLKFVSKSEEDRIDEIKALTDRFEERGLQDKFRRLAELDGFYGRGHLFVDTGDVDSRDEMKSGLSLDPRKIGKGTIRGYKVIEPAWSYPGFYNSIDPLRPDWYVPLTWYVMGKEVHRTRFLTFISREMPDLLKPAYSFGGLSMSQMAKPYVDNWLRTRQSVSDLTHNFSLTGLKTNLQAMLQTDSGEQEFRRLQLFCAARDNQGALMVDKDTEEVFNVSAPLGSLDKLQAQAQEHMASVSHIPLVVLTGISPSGLNATSKEERAVWGEWIKSMQVHLFLRHLVTIARIEMLDMWGEIYRDIIPEFEPLEEENAQERATTKKTEADTVAVYVGLGAVSPEEVRESIAADPELQMFANIDLSQPLPPLQPEGFAGSQEGAIGSEPNSEGLQRGVEGLVRSAVTSHDMATDAEFEESEHPRDTDGKFTSSGEGRTSTHLVAKESDGQRTGPDGSPLPAHIANLKIPPAWKGVTYSANPNADLLVTGRDAKGRLQAIYSERFAKSQAAIKFARIKELNEKFTRIRAQNEDARNSDNARIRDSADALRLIMETGIRPGSDEDTQAKVKAYGATTLEGRHVVQTGDGVFLRFIGKKGVSLDIPVRDTETAKMLKTRAAEAGETGKLFPATNHAALLAHTHSLDGGSFKTKDFRTLLGTKTALDEIAKLPAPKDEKSYRKSVMDVAKKVSRILGNTPTVALQSYINPSVFAEWRQAIA